MSRDTVIILGIPIDNLSMKEAIKRIFDMIDTYRYDRIPKQVATVNVDFIVNTLSWRLKKDQVINYLDAQKVGIEWTEKEVEYFTRRKLGWSEVQEAFGGKLKRTVSRREVSSETETSKQGIIAFAIILAIIIFLVMVLPKGSGTSSSSGYSTGGRSSWGGGISGGGFSGGK